MRGDFSRLRFNQGKGYTAVLEQQGRVALDADANEQSFIDGYLRGTETIDVIGQYGGPSDDCGFQVSIVGDEIVIGAGRYYVNGLMCENPASLLYDSQPYLLNPTSSGEDLLAGLKASGGDSVVQVYLEVWQRWVTALDDPCLLEPALGQADTTGRLQTVWRVVAGLQQWEAGPASQDGLSPCCLVMYRGSEITRLSTGTLSATTGGPSSDCGCQPVPAGGYQGVENQLYRVEIHTTGDESTATFKWSRENGSVVSAVTDVSSGNVTVAALPPDANLGYQVQGWVELGDDTKLFGDPPNQPGSLFTVQSIQPATPSLTLDGTPAVNPEANARVHRWDQVGPTAGSGGVPLDAGNWLTLENGIQVQFSPGYYNTGDYWTIPARANTGTIDWPPCDSTGNAFQSPAGTPVYRAPLACLHWQREHFQPLDEKVEAKTDTIELPIFGHFTWDDCRLQFEPLTELTKPAVNAIHVTAISWSNDDTITLDQLVAGGLTVTLDGDPSGPVTASNFIVTVEPVLSDFSDAEAEHGTAALDNVSKTLPTTWLRGLDVIDSAVNVSRSTLSWSVPVPRSSIGQYRELMALQALLMTGAPYGEFARARVRLAGNTIFSAGSSGNSYLDGRALATIGTRADGAQSLALQLPSGGAAASSDFDSWFFLAPVLGFDSLTMADSGAYVVLVDRSGQVTGLEATVNGATVSLAAPSATLQLNYPPVVTAQLGSTPATPLTVTPALSITQSSSGTIPDTSSIVTVPTSVTIEPGSSTVTIPITVEQNPADGVTLTVLLSASGASQGGFTAFTTTTFTLTGGAPTPIVDK